MAAVPERDSCFAVLFDLLGTKDVDAEASCCIPHSNDTGGVQPEFSYYWYISDLFSTTAFWALYYRAICRVMLVQARQGLRRARSRSPDLLLFMYFKIRYII
jgi:hypothetical protein